MEDGCRSIVLAFIFIFCSIINEVKNQDIKTVTIQMPNIKPPYMDVLLCRALRVDPTVEYYITSYEPLADMGTAHHLSVLGCEEPGSTEDYWDCSTNLGKKKDFKFTPMCKSGTYREFIYMWANNAGKLEMPKDVGFMIGGKSKIQYIVIQVHYISIEKFAEEGVTDNTGLKISYTDIPTPKIASIYRVTSGGRILANTTEYFEVSCKMTNEIPIYPFAFRVHTHQLGKVVSGYKAVKGKDVYSEKWTLIGKTNPQLPQAFYPVENEIEIRKGDYLMARCTYVNDRNVTVRAGSTSTDEMCMYYIMFWTKSKDFSLKTCHSAGPPFFTWLHYGFMLPPKDASMLPVDNHVYDAHPINFMN